MRVRACVIGNESEVCASECVKERERERERGRIWVVSCVNKVELISCHAAGATAPPPLPSWDVSCSCFQCNNEVSKLNDEVSKSGIDWSQSNQILAFSLIREKYFPKLECLSDTIFLFLLSKVVTKLTYEHYGVKKPNVSVGNNGYRPKKYENWHFFLVLMFNLYHMWCFFSKWTKL